MPTIKFITQSTKKDVLAPLYVRFSSGREGDIWYKTELYVTPDHWSNKRQSFKNGHEDEVMEKKIDDLKRYLKDKNNARPEDGESFNREWLAKIINEFLYPPVKLKEQSLNSYIDSVISEMESGERLTIEKKQRYQNSTLKNFKGFQTQFTLFQELKGKKCNFNDITIDFYDSFVAFFVAKNYSPNTIGRHIKNLKTIMHMSRDEGLHNNTEVDRKKFRTIKEPVDSIYLTESDLVKLRMVKLDDEDKVRQIARDIFLVGCYTSQRFSDYSRIKKEHIRVLENGKSVIDMVQKKTRERVVIPIKPELDEILEKYGFNLPHSYEQQVNKEIKEVAKKAKINESVVITEVRGGFRVESTIPKYKLIKTHTARRTGCTNMYLAGIPVLDIMKVSGHKTEKEFMKYIKVSKEETARSLSDHPYFNQTIKIAK